MSENEKVAWFMLAAYIIGCVGPCIWVAIAISPRRSKP
jgi:hypothetical protein